MKNKTHITRGILIANTLLLAALLYSLAGLLAAFEKNDAFDPGARIAEPPEYERNSSSGTGFHAPAVEEVDFSALASGDLFGISGAAQRSREPLPDEIMTDEEYQLPDIVLLGTVAGGEALARALIRTEAGEQRFYRTGDHVAGLRIEHIQPRGIVLLREGNRYDIKVDFAGGGDAGTRAPRSGDRGGERRTPSETDSQVAVRRWGTRRGEMSEEERQRRLEALRERRERLLEQADPDTRERIIERIRRAEERMQSRSE